jgi:hypothetical protein
MRPEDRSPTKARSSISPTTSTSTPARKPAATRQSSWRTLNSEESRGRTISTPAPKRALTTEAIARLAFRARDHDAPAARLGSSWISTLPTPTEPTATDSAIAAISAEPSPTASTVVLRAATTQKT